MELGRELFESSVPALGSILAPIAKDWYWVETKRGAAIMAVEEAEGEPADVGSHRVLSSTWDDTTVAVGDRPEAGLTIIEQMEELRDLLRQFAVNADKEMELRSDPVVRQVFYNANKALCRMVDVANRFLHEY